LVAFIGPAYWAALRVEVQVSTTSTTGKQAAISEDDLSVYTTKAAFYLEASPTGVCNLLQTEDYTYPLSAAF